jgi:hypothetical protein
VIPKGFRGAFLIYTNQAAGVEPERAGVTYTLVIPESGVLRIKGAGPFSQWHDSVASFQDGPPLLNGYTGQPPPPPPGTRPVGPFPDELIALWAGGAGEEVTVEPGKVVKTGPASPRIHYWFVGTKKEAAAFFRETADRRINDIKVGGVPK